MVIPVGCQIFCRGWRVEKDILIHALEGMSRRKSNEVLLCRRSFIRSFIYLIPFNVSQP
jgi:hypothetical protein